jgi:mono/diheme cytochrome c family protein
LHRLRYGTRGKPFAGGGALETPFGTLLALNITPDVATGIGGWTDDQFVNAVQNGIGRGGIHLYPAMPYTYYTRITRDDVIAIRAYLVETVEPVENKVIANRLPFPFNQRETIIGWNELYFRPDEFKSDPSKSEEWNRGACLVEGAEHCGLCHTPRNAMGGDESSQAMQGSVLQNWYMPNITGNRRVGIGDWTVEDIALYLKTGRNRYDIASRPMADAVTHSLSHLTDADLRTIAVYLKDLPPGGGGLPQPVPAQDPSMQRGQAIYNQQCAACHTVGGEGIVGLLCGRKSWVRRCVMARWEQSLSKACVPEGLSWGLDFLSTAKRSVKSEPLSVRMVWTGSGKRSRKCARKPAAMTARRWG